MRGNLCRNIFRSNIRYQGAGPEASVQPCFKEIAVPSPTLTGIFHIVTLGCKVNQYESRALAEAWLAFGLVEAQQPAGAGIVVVNSCAVTANAVADVRAAVRRLHREAPGAGIVLTGCAAEAVDPGAKTHGGTGAELAKLPGVIALVGQKRKALLLKRETLAELLRLADCATGVPPRTPPGAMIAPGPPRFSKGAAGGPASDACDAPQAGGERSVLSAAEKAFPLSASVSLQSKSLGEEGMEVRGKGRDPFFKRGPSPSPALSPLPSFPPFSLSGYDRSRAVLKVQDGCSHGCAYCIVPLTRGRAVSRPAAEALAEARRLLAGGFREIGLSGVNLRQYGRDLTPPLDFWDLLAFLDRELAPEWAGRTRLRLSSLEPGQLGNKALDVLAGCRMVAPHLHLSLQSGSPSVLRRMGRGHYAPGDAPEFLRRLRELWPLYGLGADLLTGFPGENAAEAEETLALCRELPLTYAHVFPYSRRPGTAAAAMADQVPEADKKNRAAALRALAQEKKGTFLRRMLELERVHVVFEDRAEEPAARNGGRGKTPEGTADADDAARRKSADFGKNAVAPGGGSRIRRGVNEFYVDCVLEGGETGGIADGIAANWISGVDGADGASGGSAKGGICGDNGADGISGGAAAETFSSGAQGEPSPAAKAPGPRALVPARPLRVSRGVLVVGI